MPSCLTISSKRGHRRKAGDTTLFLFCCIFFCLYASHGMEIGHPMTHITPLNVPNSSERKIKCQICTIDYFNLWSNVLNWLQVIVSFMVTLYGPDTGQESFFALKQLHIFIKNDIFTRLLICLYWLLLIILHDTYCVFTDALLPGLSSNFNCMLSCYVTDSGSRSHFILFPLLSQCQVKLFKIIRLILLQIYCG